MSSIRAVNEDNIKELLATLDSLPSKTTAHSGGGSGGYNEGMEARVKTLEEAVKNLPTKTDFAELRADMHKNTVEIQRWMITTVIALFLGFSGLFFTMNSSLKPANAPAPVAQQAPIIINVPSVAPAPAPAPAQQ